MAREHAVFFKKNLPIPRDAFTLEGFRRWVASAGFPKIGRIDFLAGDFFRLTRRLTSRGTWWYSLEHRGR
jgi:hypothetical protein